MILWHVKVMKFFYFYHYELFIFSSLVFTD